MGKNILLLDDDRQFCKLVVPILEGRGHKVTQADTAEAGKQALASQTPDLIIVCGPLPDSNGVDWVNTIRASGNEVAVVFVAANPHDLTSFKAKLNSLGIKLSVHKPVIPFVFGAQVESQFADNASGQAAKLKDFETMFMALVTKYARVLPSKIQELSAAIEKAKASPEDAALVGEVRAQAHKVKGTGGSLGFRQVSEIMAFIEATAVAMPDKPVDEQALLWAEIDRKLIEAQIAGEAEAKEVMSVVSGKEDEKEEVPSSPSLARILVMDADTGFLDVVEDLGRQRLVEIVRASTREEALDKAVGFPLDAALVNVLSDHPEESFQLARELRGLPGYETLPLAFISGDAIIKDQVEASYAGASLFLDKPLQSDSLEKAVQHLVAIRTGGRPRVLITDDDEFFGNTVALVLRNEGMIVRTLTDPSKILDVMQDFPPDMLLLDVMMPGITGFEVCTMLRQTPRWQDLPIIFLTGQTGVEARVEAFRCGGDDYLPKPVVNEELLTRVKVRLDRARMLRERSDKDTITGLLLRRAFSEQLLGIIAEAQRLKTSFSICLMDIDHFKKVNDTYGHLAGDRVLAGFGQLLSRRFRVDDLRGRWGGEEFILAFRREIKETIHAAIMRVLDEFKSMVFHGDHGEEFHVSFSGGLATFAEDGESVFELLQVADRRLYIAKKQGRSRVILTDDVDAGLELQH